VQKKGKKLAKNAKIWVKINSFSQITV